MCPTRSYSIKLLYTVTHMCQVWVASTLHFFKNWQFWLNHLTNCEYSFWSLLHRHVLLIFFLGHCFRYFPFLTSYQSQFYGLPEGGFALHLTYSCPVTSALAMKHQVHMLGGKYLCHACLCLLYDMPIKQLFPWCPASNQWRSTAFEIRHKLISFTEKHMPWPKL